MYVCICKGVTDEQVQLAVSEHGPDPHSLITAFEFDRDCCGRCAEDIEELIQLATRRSAK